MIKGDGIFSRLSDFMKPSGVAKDPRAQAQVQPDKREGSGARQETPQAPDDDTLFSIGAIRALLQAQTTPPGEQAELDDILKKLAMLEQQGTSAIPVALGQSIYEAVRHALANVPRT